MPQKRKQIVRTPPANRQRILIFSPDADLAYSLTLLLEDRYEVVKETAMERLGQCLKETSPGLLLVDLFSTPQDGLKQLLHLERLRPAVPLILLRAYRSNTLMDDAIKRLNAYVFYKPVNIDMVVDLVQNLIGVPAHRQGKHGQRKEGINGESESSDR